MAEYPPSMRVEPGQSTKGESSTDAENIPDNSEKLKQSATMLRVAFAAKKLQRKAYQKNNDSKTLNDAEQLAMVAASYTEMTGKSLPPHITTAEEAMAELKKLTQTWWDEEEEEEAVNPFAGRRASSELSELTPLQRLKRGMRLVVLANKFQNSSYKAARRPPPTKEDIDEDALEMLRASYREITGRRMPENITIEQAYRELQEGTFLDA